jgi:hypothetical protein
MAVWWLTLFGTGVFAASPLCADWKPVDTGVKCEPAQTCCPPGPTPGTCESFNVTSNSFISQEHYEFAANDKFSVELIVATGSCGAVGLAREDGTTVTTVVTVGTYTAGGNNTALGNGWQKVTYTPKFFEGTVAKTNKDIFFTPGLDVGGTQVGPCINLLDHFNNNNTGCPCNGTWRQEPFVNASYSPGTRKIVKSMCMENGNTTCPENFFFNMGLRYGNFRVTNNSGNATRTLEITRPSFDNTTGWNDSRIYAVFIANFTCPTTISQDTPAPTMHSGSAIFMSSAVVVGLLLVFNL